MERRGSRRRRTGLRGGQPGTHRPVEHGRPSGIPPRPGLSHGHGRAVPPRGAAEGLQRAVERERAASGRRILRHSEFAQGEAGRPGGPAGPGHSGSQARQPAQIAPPISAPSPTWQATIGPGPKLPARSRRWIRSTAASCCSRTPWRSTPSCFTSPATCCGWPRKGKSPIPTACASFASRISNRSASGSIPRRRSIPISKP